MLGAITQLPCQQKRVASAVAGAAVVWTGCDTLFPLPPVAHYAAAGMLVDITCRGGDISPNQNELITSAVWGIGGAFVYARLLGGGGFKLM